VCGCDRGRWPNRPGGEFLIVELLAFFGEVAAGQHLEGEQGAGIGVAVLEAESTASRRRFGVGSPSNPREPADTGSSGRVRNILIVSTTSCASKPSTPFAARGD